MDSALASSPTPARRLPVDFDACPVCRGTLEDSLLAQASPRCPHCDTDLKPYLELAARSGELLAQAAEMLARGDADLAAEVVARLPLLVADPGPLYWELAARLAISRRDWESAAALAAKVPGPLAGEIASQLERARQGQRSARELFNYALSCARRGEYLVASDSLEQALHYAPDDPALWRLKLKVDLKAGRQAQALADLAGLDRLGARPAEFAGVEKLLAAG